MRATLATDETLVTSLAPAWPLETERLLLRPFEQADLEALYAIHSDEQNVRRLYNDACTRRQVEELLERKIAGGTLRAEGEWQSELVYAMPAREWTSRPSSSNT